MSKNNQTSYKLAPLRRALWGKYPEIAKRSGKSEKSVQRFMAGDYWIPEIYEAAMALKQELEQVKKPTSKK